MPTQWIFLCTVIFSLFANATEATTLASAQTELKQLQAQLVEAQSQKSSYITALELNAVAINRAENTPSPEKDIFEQIQQNISELEKAVLTDSSKIGELKNEKNKLILAEHKLKKSNKELDELSDEKSAMEQQLATTERKIIALNDSISQHQSLISQLKTQQLSWEKNRVIEQQKELERLKAENERLKAAKAAQLALAEKLSLEKQTQASQLAPIAPKNTVALNIPSRSQRATVTYLSDPILIEAERQRQTIAIADRQADGKTLALFIRIEGKPTRQVTFKHLGGNQYRGMSHLYVGNASLSLNDYQWDTVFPDAVVNKKMAFLLDLSEPNTPYLVYFDSSIQP